MPRDRLVTVEDLPIIPPSGAAEPARGAGQSGAFHDFGASAKKLVSPPTASGLSLLASIHDTRLSLSARSASLSHAFATPAGDLRGTIGITDGQRGFYQRNVPPEMTLGLNLSRPPPKEGAGLLSCALHLDAAQRACFISSAMAFLGGGLKAGAAAALGGDDGRLVQSYSLGCEAGSAAAGAVSVRCDGAGGAPPSALTLSMLAPPVALGGGSLSLAAEVTLGGGGGGGGGGEAVGTGGVRVGAAVPLANGVRAQATADASGRFSFHLLVNDSEGGFGPWRRGARGLPPAFAVGATLGAAPHGASSVGGGGGGGAAAAAAATAPVVAFGWHTLRLVGARAVVLPAAISAAPLLVSVEPEGR